MLRVQVAFESRDRAEAALAMALQRQTDLSTELEAALQQHAILSEQLKAAYKTREPLVATTPSPPLEAPRSPQVPCCT